jgi:UDP-N-acetylmuramate dehydrogenase
VDLKSGEIRQIAADDCRFGYRNSIFKRAWKGRYCVSRVLLRLSKAPHMLQLSYGAIGLTLAEMGVATPTIRDVSVAVCMIRRAKLPDPKALGNAGSFFKNPVVTEAQLRRILGAYPRLVYFPTEKGRYKLAAGWLIENLGWKGYRRGDAGCYEKQALVLVNHGRAAGEDIHKLALRIAASVEEAYGVRLEPEVNIWGV